jgi:hypothetical protein
MAKRATPAGTGTTKRKRAAAKPRTKAAARKPARAAGADRRKTSDRRKSDRRTSDLTAADALFKLIESPLVADLLAVGATAALAAIAESRFSRKDDVGRKSSKALKAAAKAAAAAMGRRLSTEVDEIRKASKKPKGAAKA